jgi:hypothetical protein
MSERAPQPGWIWPSLWSFLAAAFAVIAIFLPGILSPTSVKTIHEPTGAEMSLSVDRNLLLAPGPCVNVTWDVQFVETVSLNGMGRAGEGSEAYCPQNTADMPTLTVRHTDGDVSVLQVPVYFTNGNVFAWGLGVIALMMFGAAFMAANRKQAAAVSPVLALAPLLAIVMIYLGYLNVHPSAMLALHLLTAFGTAMTIAAIRWDLPDEKHDQLLWFYFLLLLPCALLYTIGYGLLRSQVVFLVQLSIPVLGVIYGLPVLVILLHLNRSDEIIKQQLNRIWLIVFGIVLALAAVEFGLAQVAPPRTAPPTEPMNIRVPFAEEGVGLRPDAEWTHRYPSNPRGTFDEDNQINYQANNAGFRDEPFTVEQERGVRRVALVGDSFAMGLGVQPEDTAASWIERTLTEEFACETEVYNFGISGYNADSYPAVVEEAVLQYEPDALLVWYFINDIGVDISDFYEEALLQQNPYFPVGSRYIQSVGLSSNWLQRRTQAELGIQSFYEAYADVDLWDATIENLDTVATLAIDNNITPILAVHPILYRLNAYPYAEIHQQVIGEADEIGYITMDLYQPLAGQPYNELWVHPIDSHPNEIAHERTGVYAAEQLATALGCNE